MAASTEAHSPSYLSLYLIPVLLIGSLAYRLFYNLYLHPLAHIPGPKLAGATYLYQTYFSLVGGSRYYIQIAQMHAKYGPVVRITPDEVHLSDANNFEVMNCVGTKYAKSTQFYDGFGIGYSTFSTGPIDIHRKRRGMLDPFFSRRTVINLQSIVQARAEKLSAIMKAKFARNEAVDLHHAFRAISVDVITEYAFGQSYDLLDRDDFGLEFFAMVAGIGPMMWIFQQWPTLQQLALALPTAVAKRMSKPLKQVLNLQEHCRTQVLVVKAEMEAGRKVEKPSIFEVLLTPTPENPVPPTPDQIKDEAYSILAAAADTTGNAMTVAAYRVVSNPEIYQTLKAELKAAFPDARATLDYQALEKLPYLTGVIKEGLRLSFGVPGRLPRIVPEPGVIFNGFSLPAGSFVSMSSWILHRDEAYFPDPDKFDPTRWLDPKEARRVDKAFISFGKGTRGCVGINLAYCELYLSLGTMFRRFENLTANDLKKDDLVYNDYFTSHNPVGSTKFHVSGRDKQTSCA